MSEKRLTFEYCDNMVADFEKVIKHLFVKRHLSIIRESTWERPVW